MELKEEEEEKDEEEEEDYNTDEVFSLELERGEKGLGLALVDTRVRKHFLNMPYSLFYCFISSNLLHVKPLWHVLVYIAGKDTTALSLVVSLRGVRWTVWLLYLTLVV